MDGWMNEWMNGLGGGVRCRSFSSRPFKNSPPLLMTPCGLCAWSAISAARFLNVCFIVSSVLNYPVLPPGMNWLPRREYQPIRPPPTIPISAHQESSNATLEISSRPCKDLPWGHSVLWELTPVEGLVLRHSVPCLGADLHRAFPRARGEARLLFLAWSVLIINIFFVLLLGGARRKEVRGRGSGGRFRYISVWIAF